MVKAAVRSAERDPRRHDGVDLSGSSPRTCVGAVVRKVAADISGNE